MENLDKIVNLCKQYGFVFQGSEIYDGLPILGTLVL